MDKFQSSRQKRISQRQEKFAAQDVGGHTTAGSGAAKTSGGGDVRKAGELRIECKYTEKDFFVLELAVLKKIQMEALRGGMEQPVLQLTFVAKHTGVQTSFAIRPHIPHATETNVLVETYRKRTRIYKDEMLKFILNDGETHIIFDNKDGRKHVFDVLLWHEFLKTLEEEDEC